MSPAALAFHTFSSFASRRLSLSAVGAVLSLLVTSATAQTTPLPPAVTPTFNVPSSATVVTPLTIGSASTLNFGAFAPGLSAGEVKMSPSGLRSGSNVTLMATNVGSPSTITVAGESVMTITLNTPDTAQLYLGPSTSMEILNFSTNLAPASKLLANGTLSFQLGATLKVSANQPIGIYTGVVPITVSYQ